jgi:hypothetical protein
MGDQKTLEEILSRLSVPRLKEISKAVYIRSVGKRAEIVERLVSYLTSVKGKQHAMNRLDKDLTAALFVMPIRAPVAPSRNITLSPMTSDMVGL